MASDIDKCGDSARNRSDLDKLRNSNHVFDAAGENVKQYYSDSESVGTKKSKTRYINPAIYVENVEAAHSATSLQTEMTPHPHSSFGSNSTPMLSGRDSVSSSGSTKRKSIRLPTVNCNGDVDEETPRCNRTYREDGPDTFRLSVASMSTTTTAKEERERNERKKQEAFNQWVARKEAERKEKLRLERLKAEREENERTITPEQRAECFRRWTERKRAEAERRRAEEVLKQYRRNERLDKERRDREKDREEKLADWVRRKEEEMKLMKTREERKAARAAIEEEKRRVDGERAYQDWLRTSKHKPLPVPLNQGALSMRGSVSQMFVNPVPWQSTI